MDALVNATIGDDSRELILEKVVNLLSTYLPKTSNGVTAERLIELDKQYGCNHYKRDATFIPAYGRGMWVYGLDGSKKMNLNATYSALHSGHCEPELIMAWLEQAVRIESMPNIYLNTVQPLLLERIALLTRMDQVILMNTGAEAVETAYKAVMQYGFPLGKQDIVAFEGSFHGRTGRPISMSSSSVTRGCAKDELVGTFGPLTPVTLVKFGDSQALSAAITDKTAAVFIEPIQGEGGINIPPDGYLNAVRQMCDEKGALLVMDEVQTGLGRTGKMFGYEHFGIEPDVICLAKALGSMVAISACAGRAKVMGLFVPGSHGSTFGGTALPCAVALKSLDIIERQREFDWGKGTLVDNSRVVGEYLLEKLQNELAHVRCVKDVRGKGLFVAIEIDADFADAYDIVHSMLEQGMVAGKASGNVVRLSPPLPCSKADVDWAVPRIVDSMPY